MTQETLSKDIQAEITFTFPMFTESREQKSFKNHRIYFAFNGRESLIWQVYLWLDANIEPASVNIPIKVFVEFSEPESLFGRLAVGNEFIVWAGMDIGIGRILKIIDLEKRADENSENIHIREYDEVDPIRDFIKSLCGKPIHFKRFMSFRDRLERFLSQEDETWDWRQKPRRPYTSIEFEHPRDIPPLSHFLPDKETPVWFFVDIDMFLSTRFLYNATFAAIIEILSTYKFSQYYIVAKGFRWVIQKKNKEFIAMGKDVEDKVKLLQAK